MARSTPEPGYALGTAGTLLDIGTESRSIADLDRGELIELDFQGDGYMKGYLFALSCALVVAPAATAQTTAPMIAGAPDQAVLRTGTSVSLKMAEPLTTQGKKLKVGQRFQLEVAEPVMVNGVTVIPAGSPATGEITDVRNKGMWGKSGRINARVLYVRANGRQIRMSGQLDDKGTTGTGGVVAAAVLIPVAGFFVTGTSANIPLGAPVTAFVDEDIAVAFAGTAPAPMMVAPTAPVKAQ